MSSRSTPGRPGQAVVSFDVLLRPTGPSPRSPSVHNIEQFRPDPEALDTCRQWLARHGVIAHDAGFSLACSAPVSVFESLFSVKLAPGERGPGHVPWRIDGVVRIPPELAADVESVTLAPPPEFFSV